MVIPTRRSSAEAVQLMFSHALGEAGAPYLIGLIAGTLDTKLEDHESKNPSELKYFMSDGQDKVYF